jgi:histidinol-phosphate aminotransferase
MAVKRFIKGWVMGLPDYVPGEYREGYIKLASNENNFGPSPKVSEVLRSLSGKTHIYPYRTEEVRQALARYAGVGADNIVLGNGSDELMDMLVKVFKGPVAGSYPSFSEYPIAAGAVGEKYVSVNLGGDFTFDAKTFMKKARKCNMFFLCSPNNPTGLSITDEELMPVLDSGKIVVLDEAYFEFSGKSRVGLIRDYDNLIVLRTLSKAFALAGLRIGYAIADADVVKAMLKVKIPFNVSSFAEAAAIAALSDVPYARKCVQRIVAGRDRIYSSLSGAFKPYESDSNFVFADVSPLSAEGFFERMLKERIIVRKFGRFRGFEGEYVRVSPGVDEETEAFIRAVARI